MRKEELIARLKSIPGNPVILMSSDAEGNDFSSLDEVCESFVPVDYEDGTTEEVFDTADLVDESDPDESVLDDFQPALILWPF
jgi:hypothetical protein